MGGADVGSVVAGKAGVGRGCGDVGVVGVVTAFSKVPVSERERGSQRASR